MLIISYMFVENSIYFENQSIASRLRAK